jgi:hypothetical protein
VQGLVAAASGLELLDGSSELSRFFALENCKPSLSLFEKGVSTMRRRSASLAASWLNKPLGLKS